MNTFLIILCGFIFGLLIAFSKLNRYNTISGLSVLKNFTVAKTIMLIIGVGSILLAFQMNAGLSVFHVKPLYLIATPVGGLIFGMGMAILGYCPGTLPISLGEGSVDALIGILGGLTGGLLFSVLYPVLRPLFGEFLGTATLFTAMGSTFSIGYILMVILLGMLMIAGAFYLNYLDIKLNRINGHRWIITGVGVAVLNIFLFLKTVANMPLEVSHSYLYPFLKWGMNKPLGASSSYPYAADVMTGFTQNSYFPTVLNSGSWQIKFLLGAFLAGLAYSLYKKSFKIRLIHTRWAFYKGYNRWKRVIWAFIGGFLLIMGARIADGCTSGHIISGGMQFAASSYLFMVFTFIGFLLTGHYFYVKPKNGSPSKNENIPDMEEP